MDSRDKASGHANGYTYLGVLFLMALMALSLTGASTLWEIEQRREKERELVFIGRQYVAAIGSYYNAASGGDKLYPPNLEELLRDSRYPNVKRHLRKPWRDPMTGTANWGLVMDPQGRVMGVHSLAMGIPIKQKGFGNLEAALADKSSYRDWVFIYNESMGKKP